jgi:GntR family transcriptional repressor for pyruvate dehydrogenase complex
MTSKKLLALQKIKRVNSAPTDYVVSQMREVISRGELRPGDRLPPERELALRLGVSRPSVRAGLRSLIAMGILRARQGSGSYNRRGSART